MILTTGRGSSGSWTVRGEQLGGAVGAAIKQATVEQCKAADVIVAVKRVNPQLLEAIRKSGKPWVLDVVDFYPQPECSEWSRSTAIEWVQRQIKKLRPNGVIWPNRRMQEDCSTGLPEAVIYHHHRPELKPRPVSKEIQNIGYEGSERYIGGWLKPILNECQARGWSFHINTLPVDKLDIVLAVRDKKYSGYAQHCWKSNVKAANAHGAGVPFVCQPEHGYLETCSGQNVYIESPDDLKSALDSLKHYDLRECIAGMGLANKITLDRCADQLRAFLDGFQ